MQQSPGKTETVRLIAGKQVQELGNLTAQQRSFIDQTIQQGFPLIGAIAVTDRLIRCRHRAEDDHLLHR